MPICIFPRSHALGSWNESRPIRRLHWKAIAVISNHTNHIGQLHDDDLATTRQTAWCHHQKISKNMFLFACASARFWVFGGRWHSVSRGCVLLANAMIHGFRVTVLLFWFLRHDMIGPGRDFKLKDTSIVMSLSLHCQSCQKGRRRVVVTLPPHCHHISTTSPPHRRHFAATWPPHGRHMAATWPPHGRHIAATVAATVAATTASCGGNVAAMWRRCGGNVAAMWRRCGGHVAAMWRRCDGDVVAMRRQCGDAVLTKSRQLS